MTDKMALKKAYYFSQRLKKRLSQIPHYPLTVVEAPSGFGKTTAIREYLRENLQKGGREYWYTCLGEPANMAWKGICGLLANVNPEIAVHLKNLEAPSMDTLLHMAALLKEFHCQSETYLVIDNYQLVNFDIPRELMSVFSMHKCPHLHMIFITQQLRAKQQFSVHNPGIHTIDSSAFFFDREGIQRLLRMEGIRLSDDELENVFRSTEGWVSAIRLQIISFQETGSFDNSADIEHLVETAIWRKLMPEEKDFLLSVSILDSFTARQAAIMIGRETLPENIEELLKSNDFIRYFPDKNTYAIHSILLDYLRNRFYNYQPEDFQNKIFRLAGRSYAFVSQYFAAAQLFWKVRDYDAILSMPFDGVYLGNQKENNILQFIVTLINECPDETLLRHPFTMLAFSYLMLLDKQLEAFLKLQRLLGEAVEHSEGFALEEKRRLRGEYAMLRAFISFNDIKMMFGCVKHALHILGGPSDTIIGTMPWMFGSTSILLMLWRKPGMLEKELEVLDESLPIFQRLTRGQCAGINSLMRAEAMLMRGDDDEAEILCHKALHEARSFSQASICLCAELALAQIAILRGDTDSYFAAVKNIRGYAKENSHLYILRLTEMCQSVLGIVLGIRDFVAPWISDPESIKKVLYSYSSVPALLIYAKLLLMDKKYNAYFGISHLLDDAAWNPAGNIQCMLSSVYQHIYSAMARHNCGNTPEARKNLGDALLLALKDQVYLPFAQQEGALQPILEPVLSFITGRGSEGAFHCNGQNSASSPAKEYGLSQGELENRIAALKALCRRQEKGAALIRRAVLQSKSSLTPREREIAVLARDRLSAREIAGRLFISEATVRTILRNVYSKLDVHSKTELNSKDF